MAGESVLHNYTEGNYSPRRLSLLDVIKYECKKLQEMRERVYSGIIHIDDDDISIRSGRCHRKSNVTYTKSSKSVKSEASTTASRPHQSKSWAKGGDKKRKRDVGRHKSPRQVKEKHSDGMLSIDEEYKKQLKNSRKGGQSQNRSKSPASTSKSSAFGGLNLNQPVYDDQKRRPASSRHLNCMYPENSRPGFKALPVPASIRNYGRGRRARSKPTSRSSLVKSQSTRRVGSGVVESNTKKSNLSDTEAVTNSMRSIADSTETPSETTDNSTQEYERSRSHGLSEVGQDREEENDCSSKTTSAPRCQNIGNDLSGLSDQFNIHESKNVACDLPSLSDLPVDNKSDSADKVGNDVETTGIENGDKLGPLNRHNKASVANKSTTTKAVITERLSSPVPFAASDPDNRQALTNSRKISNRKVTSNSISEPSTRQYHKLTGSRPPGVPKPYIPPCAPRSAKNRQSRTICECCSNTILNVEDGRLCENCTNRTFRLDTQKSIGKQLRNYSETKFLKYEQSKRNGTLAKELGVTGCKKRGPPIVRAEELLDADDLEEIEVEVRLYLQDFDGTGTML